MPLLVLPLALASPVAAGSSEAQAASSSAAAIAVINLRRILSSHPLCLSQTVRTLSPRYQGTQDAGLFGNSATDGLARRPALRTPGIARNIVHYCLLSKGDQAGSEPSIRVFMTRSLCPVRSIEWSCARPLGSWV